LSSFVSGRPGRLVLNYFFPHGHGPRLDLGFSSISFRSVRSWFRPRPRFFWPIANIARVKFLLGPNHTPPPSYLSEFCLSRADSESMPGRLVPRSRPSSGKRRLARSSPLSFALLNLFFSAPLGPFLLVSLPTAVPSTTPWIFPLSFSVRPDVGISVRWVGKRVLFLLPYKKGNFFSASFRRLFGGPPC